MSLVQCIWFCVSGNGETGGGGWVHLKGANSMDASGLGSRRTLVSPEWPISALLCMTGLRKQPSGLARYPKILQSWC